MAGPPSNGLASIWGKDDTAAAKMLAELGPRRSGDDPLYFRLDRAVEGRVWSDHRGVVSGTMSYVSQSAMAAALLTQQGHTRPTASPCALIAVPLFHVTGEVPLYLQSYGIGRKLVIMPKWDAREALRLMEQEKVTYFVGVPLMSYEIATHPERGRFDLSACKSFAAGGAPRPVDHVTAIRDAFPEGFPLLGYGLTETNGVGCGNFNENYLAKPGSTGKASRPLVDLAILDDDGNPLPQGAVGEVCIRTVANFKGYWQDDEATEAAFTDNGYFRTGDLGYLDEDDYLFIVDRKKDIIIRGGENISCIEVEEGIYAHKDVAECSCFSLPDERFGEIPAAVYHMKEGHALTPEQLREFMSDKLAPFKVPLPEHIWLSDIPLPRLGTQKIDKRAVRALFAASLTNQTRADM